MKTAIPLNTVLTFRSYSSGFISDRFVIPNALRIGHASETQVHTALSKGIEVALQFWLPIAGRLCGGRQKKTRSGPRDVFALGFKIAQKHLVSDVGSFSADLSCRHQ